jgi:hypothetical protein
MSININKFVLRSIAEGGGVDGCRDSQRGWKERG